MTRHGYGLILLSLVGVWTCEGEPVESSRIVLEQRDGDLRGLRLEVPAGAYTGAAPLSMGPGTDIPLEGVAAQGETASIVSPACEFGPSGTEFSKPVTISLPFSSQAYNAVDLTNKKIDVLHQTADGSVAGFDVGPISKVGFDVGPISSEHIGFDVGPISIVANEGNEINDALLVFQTTHFSSYQVVVVGEEGTTPTVGECPCEQGLICNSQEQCVACAGWTQVSAGDFYTCGLYDIGSKTELYCWGDPAPFALGSEGQSKLKPRNAPRVAVQAGDNKDWLSVGTAVNHTCAIDVDKNLYCWGNDAHGKIGTPSTGVKYVFPNPVGKEKSLRFESVALGINHTCAISKDKELYCWGWNKDGQLGQGNTSGSASEPKKVLLNADSTSEDWRAVVAGADFTCGLTQEDALYCWGNKSQGATGTPTKISGATADQFKEVSAGGRHTCAISSGMCGGSIGQCAKEGTLFCWGANEVGQLGLGLDSADELMGPVGDEQKWISVEAANHHTCAISKTNGDAKLWCWGSNASQQLMVDPATTPTSNVPIEVGAEYEWEQLSGGEGHLCGLVKSDGGKRLLCNGSNSNGQLGVTNDMMMVAMSSDSIPVCPPEEGICTPVCIPGTCGGNNGCGAKCDCPANQQCISGLCEISSLIPTIGIDQCKASVDQSLLKAGGFLDFLGECVAVDCGVMSASDAEVCMSPCLEADNFSAGCAGCFADLVVCAYENCANKCGSEPAEASWSCDPACLTSNGCFDAMTSCTGLCGDNICQTGVENLDICPEDCAEVGSSPCLPDCIPGTCGSDGCGGTCTCDKGVCTDGFCVVSECDYKSALVSCDVDFTESYSAPVNQSGELVLGINPQKSVKGLFLMDLVLNQKVSEDIPFVVAEVAGGVCGPNVDDAIFLVNDKAKGQISLEFEYQAGKKYVLRIDVGEMNATELTVTVNNATCMLTP